MKKVLKGIGLAIFALTLSTQAFALILIEPYGGYDFSLNGENNNLAIDKNFDFSGFGGGARLGFQVMTLMFGVSYDVLWLDVEPENGTKESVDQTNIGAFAGWNSIGGGVRLWGEYFFDVENDPESTDVNQEGDGWGVGLGYKFHPFMAINAEYRSWSLDKPAGTDITGDSIFVSLSFPFNIL